jgi:hypothetical protein
VKADELAHLLPSRRNAALLSNDGRIHWLRQERWIQYPRAERILERLIDRLPSATACQVLSSTAQRASARPGSFRSFSATIVRISSICAPRSGHIDCRRP